MKRLHIKKYARLKLMYDMFHMDNAQGFRFSWDDLPKSGLSVKDYIAPSSFEFANGSGFGIGDKHGTASFLSILAPELSDRMLAEFLDMDSSLVVSMHIQSVDQVKAIKTIKRKITDLDKMKIEEQKKAVRSGYDMDIIPSDLATYGSEAKKLTDAAVDCLETVEKIICKSDVSAAFIPNDFGKVDEPVKDEPTKDSKLDETTPSTLVEMFPRDLYERLTELCDNVIMLNETVENLCEKLVWEAHYEV